MSARVQWRGLTELMAQLRQLPADLAQEAGAVVVVAAENAKTEIVGVYLRHRHTGTLAGRVTVDRASQGLYGARAIVKSSAKHAWMFEYGTAVRRTRRGANRGRMPASHPASETFVGAMKHHRTAMYDALKFVVAKQGLKVSGDAR